MGDSAYYKLFPIDNRDDGTATWDMDLEVMGVELDINFLNPRPLEQWPLQSRFGFTKTTHPKDYPSFDAIRIVSSRFREALEEAMGPGDRIQFFPATIDYGDQSDDTYWIAYFPDRFPVLNLEYSEKLGSVWGRITLDASQLEGHDVFALPSASQASFAVSDQARRIIERYGIEGIQFDQIRVR